MLTLNRIALAAVALIAGSVKASAQRPSVDSITPAQADSIFKAGDFKTAAHAYESLTVRMPKTGPMWFRLGMSNYKLDNFARAAVAFETAAGIAGNPVAMYDAGAACARAGNADKAFAWLAKAAATGQIKPEAIKEDEDLAGIRTDARFATLLADAAKAQKP
jgi:hypothetical protein